MHNAIFWPYPVCFGCGVLKTHTCAPKMLTKVSLDTQYGRVLFGVWITCILWLRDMRNIGMSNASLSAQLFVEIWGSLRTLSMQLWFKDHPA